MKNYNKITYLLNTLLFIFVMTTFAYSIFIAGKVPAAGQKFTAIINELTIQQKRNDYLSFQLSKLSSADLIYTYAIENKYVKANIEYLTIPALAYK